MVRVRVRFRVGLGLGFEITSLRPSLSYRILFQLLIHELFFFLMLSAIDVEAFIVPAG